MSAAVIIPTTGDPKVLDAIASSCHQTYDDTRVYVVIDGLDFAHQWVKTHCLINDRDDWNKLIFHEIQLPSNTGANGMYGHRIYAGIPHLLNEEYIFFLDQDNFYEKNHVESMIDSMKEPDTHFAYSLRNIVDKDGSFLVQDNCESLGHWPVFNCEVGRPQYHVDTSAYGFKKHFIQHTCHLWHGGYAQDRRFYEAVRGNKHNCTGLYSMNYRIDGNPGSLQPDFIRYGNIITEKTYNGKYPWQKQTQVI